MTSAIPGYVPSRRALGGNDSVVRNSVPADQYRVYKLLSGSGKVRVRESAENAPIDPATVRDLRPARIEQREADIADAESTRLEA